jgi:hypothetical protein
LLFLTCESENAFLAEVGFGAKLDIENGEIKKLKYGNNNWSFFHGCGLDCEFEA